MSPRPPSLLSRLLAVGTPVFYSPARFWAFLGLGLLLALLLGINALNVCNSFVARDLMTALAGRNVNRFYMLAAVLVGVFAASTLVEVTSRFVEQRLGLAWRDWLTHRLLDRYLADRSYIRLGQRGDVDNPDQRISEDVRSFTQMSLSFFILLLNATLTVIAFAGVLWSITPWLLVAAVGYATAGSLGAIFFGRHLVGLDNTQLRREADFRFALGRLREQAAAVAQSGGEETERQSLNRKIAEVIDNFRRIIAVNRSLGYFTTGYNYLTQIIPAAIVAPLYVSGSVDFGAVPQAAMAFSQALGAFSLIISQFQQLSSYAAVTQRLGAMWEATAPDTPEPAKEPTPGPGIEQAAGRRSVAYEGLTLRTPEGRVLVHNLTLQFPEGKRVAVVGPAASGKTALAMATAGLWRAGDGRVILPTDALFVPERPRLAPGTLREALAYGPGLITRSDDELREALREAGLASLAASPDGLDAERDWADVLSAGEQRALAAARILIARPPVVFLDGPVPDRLYRALMRRGVPFITLGCTPELLRHHDFRLTLRGDGCWTFGPAGCEDADQPTGQELVAP